MTVQKPRIAVTAKGPRTRERAKVGSHAILILPDAHHPFHDARVMAVIEAVAAAVRPARIVSLGDWLDAAAFSQHSPASLPERALHAFSHELETCGRSMDRIRKAARAGTTWQYLKGNHEGHVDRACIKLGAMGMAVLDMLDPQRVLGRDRPWVKFTPYVADYAQSSPTGTRGAGLSHYKIARDLWAVHGWSVAKAAAQRHLDMAKTVSIVHGHTHRMQHVTGRVMEDNRIVHAWSPGCLSDLQPRWHHTSPTEWAHGFSLVYAADDCLTARRPRWTPYTITVDRGECVLPGGTRVAA
jgi:UDP-2,3-diacylglucosamine pyrophosphatase LpxH